jgi:hypothetical protein
VADQLPKLKSLASERQNGQAERRRKLSQPKLLNSAVPKKNVKEKTK